MSGKLSSGPLDFAALPTTAGLVTGLATGVESGFVDASSFALRVVLVVLLIGAGPPV